MSYPAIVYNVMLLSNSRDAILNYQKEIKGLEFLDWECRMRLPRLHFVRACNDRNVRTVKQIRRQARKSMNPGSNDFIEKLEKKLNRLSKLKPRGRPKKERK